MAYTTINKPSSYFNTKLYTGTGATNNVTGVGFKPDWTWIKCRNSGADWHRLIDAVRGVTKELYSNATNAESTQAQSLQTFNTDGFTLGTLAEVNANGNTFVSWNWLGANSTVSNTQGTISSTISVNQTSGFSVGIYTGTGATGGTVGHGLGVAPSMIIVKNRDSAVNEWVVYTKTNGKDKLLLLNSTNAVATVSGYWGSAEPTSSVFGVYAAAGAANNNSGNSLVFYAFAEIKGYSSFASYTGNGSTDGAFVYTGFKPAYVMSKGSSLASSWNIQTNQLQTYNDGSMPYFKANTADAELSATNMDFLSNGFKLRTTDNDWNGSGQTYIYMAFAENPFVSSTFIPTTAR